MYIKRRLYWIIPIMIALIGLLILFFQNLAEVTEAPEDNWSRELHVGQTKTNNYPFMRERQEGTIEITEFANDTLINNVYDNEYKLIEEIEFSNIPVDKWTQAYVNGNSLIYFDYHDIFDGKSNEKLSSADKFYPLSTTILYTYEDKLYQLNPETKESTVVLDITEPYDKVAPIETDEGIFTLFYFRDGEELITTVYQIDDQNTDSVFTNSFPIPLEQEVQEAKIAVSENNIALAVKTEIKSRGGKAPIFTTYLYNPDNNNLEPITLNDPKGFGELRETNDISISFVDEEIRLLFSAKGSTDAAYGKSTAFNIYEASVTDSGIEVERRSNTAYLSGKPQWINPNLVSWIDLQGESYPIYLSSGDEVLIEKASDISNDDLVNGLGKTFGMLSASFLAFILSVVMWGVGPLLFIAILFIARKTLLDEDPNWIYYGGLFVYLLCFFLFKDNLFIDNIYLTAPNYLTFTGSSYVYLLIFGLIACYSTYLGDKGNEWGSPTKIVYFISVNILLFSVFFGPYFL